VVFRSLSGQAGLLVALAATVVGVGSVAACGSEDPAADPPQGSSGASGGPTATSTSSTTPPTPTPTTTSTTPPPPPADPVVRFVAMGDTGTGSNDQLKIGNAIAAKCKKDGCDFVQLLGDNLYDSGASSIDDPIWQTHFEIPYAAIDLDFYAVLGNHDYGGGGLGTDFPKGKNEIDYTKKSKKWKMPAAHYHWTKQHVEFFGLDTNLQMFSMDAQQKTDVSGWIAASKSAWKIAFGHHPYKSNGPHGNAGIYDLIPIAPPSGKGVKDFMDDVICGKVDLYLSGHDHSQQWLNVSCKGTELAVSGAGAKTTELPGNNPVLYQSLELAFLYVVINGKTLTAQFVDENGNVEFTHTLTKP